MTEHEMFERRLADALRTYAAEVAIDVESIALARSISIAHPRRRGLAALLVQHRRLGWLVVAAMLLALAFIALLVAAQRDPVLGAGMLAFSRDGNVYLASADGSQAVLVVDKDHPFSVMTWSPDGRWLVVESDGSLYRLDPVTLGLSRLPAGRWSAMDGKSLSPDGRFAISRGARQVGNGIAYVGLDIVDLETGASRRVGPDQVCLPVWSPDGRSIAGVVPKGDDQTGVTWHVVVIDVDSESVVEIGAWSGYGCGWSTGWDAPTWSPDSRRIAFVGNGSISVAERDGTDVTRIVESVVEWPRPLWSPDGEWIAYRGDDGLRLVRPDGRVSRLLAPGFVDRQRFEWTADGSRIDLAMPSRSRARVTNEPPVELWSVDIATGAIEPIKAAGTEVGSFARQPHPIGQPAPSLPAEISPTASAAGPVISTPAPGLPVEPSSVALGLAFDIELGTPSFPTGECAAVFFRFADRTTDRRTVGCPQFGHAGWSPDGSAYAEGGGTVITRDGTPIGLAVAGAVPAGRAWWSPGGGWLAFASCITAGSSAGPSDAPSAAPMAAVCDQAPHEGTLEYQIVRPDGSQRRSVAGEPRWSPRDERVAVSNAAGTLHVGSGDGSDLRPIGSFPPVAAWSPDSEAFAYVRDGEVWIANVDGSGARPSTAFGVAASAADVAWSPDGELIAIVHGEVVWIVPPDGGEPRRVQLDGLTPSTIKWSPDGSHLAISMENATGTGGVLLLAVDEWRAAMLVDTLNPIWSPDGSLVAVGLEQDSAGRGVIAIVRADGTGRYEIETGGLGLGDLRWVP
jgi:Tol biopolymer transport system component